MKKGRFGHLFAGAAASALLAVSVIALGGCATSSETVVTQEEQQEWDYLSTVNQTVEQLADELEGFSTAILNGEPVQTVGMHKILDDLSSLEAPEAYEDVQSAYAEGCDLLGQALDEYSSLRTEIESATEAFPFDYSTYDDRMAEIQRLYDDGIAKIDEADQKAAEQ